MMKIVPSYIYIKWVKANIYHLFIHVCDIETLTIALVVLLICQLVLLHIGNVFKFSDAFTAVCNLKETVDTYLQSSYHYT